MASRNYSCLTLEYSSVTNSDDSGQLGVSFSACSGAVDVCKGGETLNMDVRA